MKCPFRTVESYTKLQTNVYARREGGYKHTASVVPCSEAEAHNKMVDFMECLGYECPYCTGYHNGHHKEKCLKAERG